MNKVKIALSEIDKTNARRDLKTWQVKKQRSELNICFQERMIESRFPIEKMEIELVDKEFQKKALEMDIETLKDEIKSGAQLEESRTKLFAEKTSLELTERNIKALEKQLRDGNFVDIQTGDFMYKNEPKKEEKPVEEPIVEKEVTEEKEHA